jgi:hypothetical protein
MPDKPTLSRRSLLRGAAGAGAAGLAVGALGVSTANAADAAEDGRTKTPSGASTASTPDGTETRPLIVHVRDTQRGDIEVFSGTSQTRLRDRDLAARIARAAG